MTNNKHMDFLCIHPFNEVLPIIEAEFDNQRYVRYYVHVRRL